VLPNAAFTPLDRGAWSPPAAEHKLRIDGAQALDLA
jgi:hypothetical protein